ncbi:hypothetical protein BGX28_009873 [Mortierella sp. GBA30]|nr:hypothetical protein BGX28_009873 [Mortierella sp. GBA30]
MYSIFGEPRETQRGRRHQDRRQDFFPSFSNSLFFDPFSYQGRANEYDMEEPDYFGRGHKPQQRRTRQEELLRQRQEQQRRASLAEQEEQEEQEVEEEEVEEDEEEEQQEQQRQPHLAADRRHWQQQPSQQHGYHQQPSHVILDTTPNRQGHHPTQPGHDQKQQHPQRQQQTQPDQKGQGSKSRGRRRRRRGKQEFIVHEAPSSQQPHQVPIGQHSVDEVESAFGEKTNLSNDVMFARGAKDTPSDQEAIWDEYSRQSDIEQEYEGQIEDNEGDEIQPDPELLRKSLAELQEIESDLHDLSQELDKILSGEISNKKRILMTEENLTKAMLRIDSVESGGDDSIRKQRKGLIDETERLLEKVDEFKRRTKTTVVHRSH